MICRCDAVAKIYLTTLITMKGVKVVLTISALFDAGDPLFRCLIHEVVLEDLMDFPRVSLEVGAC